MRGAGVWRKAFAATLPVMAGYIFLGIAYGMAMQARGFAVGWSVLASLTVYGGSLQFAMIDPIVSMVSPLTFAMLCLLIQARHLFYGLTMLAPYSRTGAARPYLVFALTDETYSLVCRGAPEGIDPEAWYTSVSLMDQAWWVTGTVLGAVIGSLIPMDNLEGIDFSMTALFLVVVTEQTMDAVKAFREGKMTLTDAAFAPLLGFAGTVLCLLVWGTSRFLLFSMALILAAFFVRYIQTERKAEA